MLRCISLFGCKPRFRPFSSSPCIEISHLTDENSGITSLIINSLNSTNEIINSLCSLITLFEHNSSTRCILLSNLDVILTDLTGCKDASAYFTEMSKRTIPMVTSFKYRISGLMLELAMSGDVRIFHESAWIEPMLELSLSMDTITHRLVSLHQRDPRADRRTRAYQLVKNRAFLGANDAVLFGLADICVPMNQDSYQAGLEICRGIVKGIVEN